MVVKPTMEGVSAAAGIGLICAFAVACRDLVTRRIASDVPSSIVTLATTIAVALMGGVIGGIMGLVDLFHHVAPHASVHVWQPLESTHVLLLLCAAFLITLGNFAIIIAFRGTDISLISPFRYSVMIWAVIGGFFVFQEWPDWIAQIGMLLIVISGVATLRSQEMREETR
jgi:drug/metabolite transporter (DMT)-like permease